MNNKVTTKFKETEIGLIPEEWEIRKFGDISNFQYGLGESAKEKGDYVYIRITDIAPDGFLKKEGLAFIEKEKVDEEYFLNKGDVLVARTGASFGKTYFFNEDFKATYGGFLIRYIFNDKLINNKFFFQYSRSGLYWNQANNLVGGGAQPQFNANVISNMLIPCPPLSEQKRIAEILSSMDDKIELNRKININLEKFANLIFKKWFFDDIENGLPDEWRIGKISDLARVESGFPFQSNTFNESGIYKLVTIKNVQDGQFITECTDSLSEVPSKVPTHCILKNGDILLSLTGNVGRVCIVHGDNYLLNQRVANLIPINENDRAFIYFLFRQRDFQNTLIGISHGTAQQNLSPIETKSLEIIIPSQDVLDRFADFAGPIFTMLVKNYKEINDLSVARDTLLSKLMSGKIRI